MLVLQKGSLSPLFQETSSMQQNYSHHSNQSESPHRFDDGRVDIDLTNHIIYDENDLTPRADEKTFRYDNDDDIIFSSVKTANSPSRYSDSDEKDVYSIDIEDIKRRKSSSPTQHQKPQEREEKEIHSPTKVKFENQAVSTIAPSQQRSVKSSNIVGARETVEVVAPATLPENFMFEAKMGDEVFMVIVVSKKGFKFTKCNFCPQTLMMTYLKI